MTIDITVGWPLIDRIRATGGRAGIGRNGKLVTVITDRVLMSVAARRRDEIKSLLVDEMVERLEDIYRIVRSLERTPEVAEYMDILQTIYGGYARGTEGFLEALAANADRAVDLARSIDASVPLEGRGLYHAVGKVFNDMAEPSVPPELLAAVRRFAKPAPTAPDAPVLAAVERQIGLFDPAPEPSFEELFA